MRHARGLYKPHATSEHDLHTKIFVSVCSVHWHLSVPPTIAMKIATSRGLLRWLAGWPPFRADLRPRSKLAQRVCVPVACALHCGYNVMGQNFSEQRVCWRENTCTHRVGVAEWPNGGRTTDSSGPCASQSQVVSLSQSFWW